MLSRLPGACLLCLDEVYADFVDEADLPFIDSDHPYLIGFWTFSEVYGFAVARVGYVLRNRTIGTAFNKIGNHFGLSRLGQVVALTALSDHQHQ